MKTFKNRLFLATAILAFASCADNTYLGDQEEATKGGGAISFGSNTPSLTRSNSTDAAKLEYKFKVFGMKTVESSDQRVFATATTGVAPYDVWFVNNTSNSTTSNSSNWEYVGAKNGVYGTASNQVTLGADQTIKYWDTNASEYNFQAWSDINDANSKVNISAISKNEMTLTATPTQLANFWISDLQSGAPNTFTNSVVQFTFRKATTKVRLGIYETVPGYHVRNLKFHYGTNQTSQADAQNAAKAILDGKFVGASNSAATEFNVTYDGTPKRAIIKPSSTANANTTYFDFGSLGTNTGTEYHLGESSTAPTWAGDNNTTDYYTSVFPNTESTNIANMILKVSYELYNTESHEVIAVNNKTAIVPAAYMEWKPNYAYTYLFKITDDKLTPITFDAVTIDDGEGNQETITTVAEPSITTYAKASNVTTNGDYKDGATIYATVWENTLQTPAFATLSNDNTKLYTITATDVTKITEGAVIDAIIKNPTLTKAEADAAEIKYATSTSTLNIGNIIEDPDGNNVTMGTNVVASFTGNKTQLDNTPTYGPTYYAIVYEKTAATYTVDSGSTYENATAFANAGTLYSDATCTTVASSFTDENTTYYKRTAVSNKGVYAVKVIKVVP